MKKFESANVCKAADIDKFLGRFLIDGLHVLSIINLWDLFIKLVSFFWLLQDCQIQTSVHKRIQN